MVNCFILSIILLAFTLSTPLDVVASASSNSSIVKLEVKNVGKWFSILYWSIGPKTSSLDQLLVFSAPISSNNNKGTFLTQSLFSSKSSEKDDFKLTKNSG